MRLFAAGITDAYTSRMRGLLRDVDLFVSFYDLPVEHVETLLGHGPRMVVCDSGAHAYFSATASAKAASVVRSTQVLEHPRRYVERYAAYIRRLRHRVNYFVELDTVELHGRDFQAWQRATLEAAAGRERLLVVVRASEWHADPSVLDALLDRYTYVGMEGVRNKTFSLADYREIVRRCHAKGVKAHAFASIQDRFLKQVPVYSSDASSASMLYRFGTMAHYNPQRVTVEFAHDAEAAPVGMRTRMRQMKTRGFNREISFRCASLMRRSLDSYRAYADALTEYWRHRGIQWPS